MALCLQLARIDSLSKKVICFDRFSNGKKLSWVKAKKYNKPCTHALKLAKYSFILKLDTSNAHYTATLEFWLLYCETTLVAVNVRSAIAIR